MISPLVRALLELRLRDFPGTRTIELAILPEAGLAPPWTARPTDAELPPTTVALRTFVGIALLAFHIKPTELDPRFGLPVGSIFAAVGSLYVTSQLLPDTNLITLSDRLHIFAFVVIFLSLVESTWSLHVWNKGDEAASHRLDRRCFWGLGAFYVVGSVVAVLTS